MTIDRSSIFLYSFILFPLPFLFFRSNSTREISTRAVQNRISSKVSFEELGTRQGWNSEQVKVKNEGHAAPFFFQVQAVFKAFLSKNVSVTVTKAETLVKVV